MLITHSHRHQSAEEQSTVRHLQPAGSWAVHTMSVHDDPWEVIVGVNPFLDLAREGPPQSP